jgi:membrane protease YdiL (CAAX protease family)
MKPLFTFIKSSPLLAFFGLAFALEWLITPLGLVSPALPPFIFTFLPAIAALVIVRIAQGKPGVKNLFGTLAIWRVGMPWYALAIGLPILVGCLCIGMALLFGSTTALNIGAFSAFRLTFFVFAAGEELGWRGFALPRLQARFGALEASVILGMLWLSFHLPLFLPGQFYAGKPIVAQLLTFISTTIIYSWLVNNSKGSALMASLFHGSMNLFGLLYTGLSAPQVQWLPALVWSLIAIGVIALTGGKLGFKQTDLPLESSWLRQEVGRS